ncbi:MAG: alpha/beta hydrolase [Saprospiraceae bacterium]
MQALNRIKAARPSLFWFATEAGRAVTELGINYSYRLLHSTESEGDGHPVVVLPGFMAGAQSTQLLRNHLKKHNYYVYDWGLGRNYGKVTYMEKLVKRVESIHQEHGEPVSLIGWSLGGVFAREIAKERPDLVRQVITMGSPFQGVKESNYLSWLHDLLFSGRSIDEEQAAYLHQLPIPASVPTTAIYSKEDGVVPWEMCMEQVETDIHQNIQVRGSHLGFGVNPAVYTIITDRLRLHKDNWEHFQPSGSLENLLFFPSL